MLPVAGATPGAPDIVVSSTPPTYPASTTNGAIPPKPAETKVKVEPPKDTKKEEKKEKGIIIDIIITNICIFAYALNGYQFRPGYRYDIYSVMCLMR